jgi:hypothetical protein
VCVRHTSDGCEFSLAVGQKDENPQRVVRKASELHYFCSDNSNCTAGIENRYHHMHKSMGNEDRVCARYFPLSIAVKEVGAIPLLVPEPRASNCPYVESTSFRR